MKNKYEELQPEDVNDEIWADLLEAVFEIHRNAVKKQVKEIKYQLAHYYLVRDIELPEYSYELIEIKECCHDLYPGNFYNQLEHLNGEMLKLALEKVNKHDPGSNEKPRVRIEEIPDDIQKIIKNNAYEAYFDDKEMFDIYILEQKEAYNKIYDYQMDGVPAWVVESIIFHTDEKYLGDYSGQFTEIRQHVKSFVEIEKIQLPQGSKIKQAMREEFPGNYNAQLKSIVNSL